MQNIDKCKRIVNKIGLKDFKTYNKILEKLQLHIND